MAGSAEKAFHLLDKVTGDCAIQYPAVFITTVITIAG